MSIDTLVLQAIVDECVPLAGSKIVAIEQYGPTEVGLVLKGSAGRQALAIAVQPNYGRIYRTSPSRKSDASSAFLNVLRDRLLAGTVDSIETVPNERIAILRCSGRTPTGSQSYRIIAELIDRHTMLVLASEPDLTIIETLRRVRTGDRDPSPGEPYEPPDCPQKIPLTQVVPEHLTDAGVAENPKQLAGFLTGRIGGLSPTMAREIIAGAELTDFARLSTEERQKRLWSSLSAVTERVVSKTWTPRIGMDDDGHPVILSAVPIASLQSDRVVAYETMNEAVERFHVVRLELELRKQREMLLQRALADEVKRLERLVENMWQDVAVSEQEDEFRKYGELLTANLSRMKYGQTEVAVRDYYDPEQPELCIALNPALSPADNAKRYFKRARKARDGRVVIEQRLLQAEKRLEKVRTVRETIESDADTEQIERAYRACIRLELIKEPRGAKKAHGVKKQKDLEIHPRRFLTSDASLVLVGRNNRENEILTKTASPDDIWLHARDMGGSHVILKRGGKKAMPSKQTCYEAACVAAHFSKGRGSTTVPVDYTERRYVRKQKDGGAGKVIFTHEKTLFVAPKLLEEEDKKAGEQ